MFHIILLHIFVIESLLHLRGIPSALGNFWRCASNIKVIFRQSRGSMVSHRQVSMVVVMVVMVVVVVVMGVVWMVEVPV